MSEEKDKKDYSIKDELKDEGTSAIKEVILGGINSLGKLGRGAIGVFTKHPKVENLKDEVDGHIEELKEAEKE